MSTAGERKFINVRKRLDQLGYRQPLGIESLPLVERLFSDLLHTTESLRNAKLSVGKNEKENKNVDAYLEPFQAENARLVEENNELHLSLLKAKEEKEKFTTIRKLEHETADLKFLNNQYVHKVKSLEKDSKAKAEKIQQLQEKNLQAIVQTPGKVTSYFISFEDVTGIAFCCLLHWLASRSLSCWTWVVTSV
uniref:Centrosomal protein of 135 kDa n=1 Tax=Erpetoichthys calabaricus TaxID=27687 RepID=A0A8C4T6Y0_ERPCA